MLLAKSSALFYLMKLVLSIRYWMCCYCCVYWNTLFNDFTHWLNWWSIFDNHCLLHLLCKIENFLFILLMQNLVQSLSDVKLKTHLSNICSSQIHNFVKLIISFLVYVILVWRFRFLILILKFTSTLFLYGIKHWRTILWLA